MSSTRRKKMEIKNQTYKQRQRQSCFVRLVSSRLVSGWFISVFFLFVVFVRFFFFVSYSSCSCSSVSSVSLFLLLDAPASVSVAGPATDLSGLYVAGDLATVALTIKDQFDNLITQQVKNTERRQEEQKKRG